MVRGLDPCRDFEKTGVLRKRACGPRASAKTGESRLRGLAPQTEPEPLEEAAMAEVTLAKGALD